MDKQVGLFEQCWCNELYLISGYRCYNCEKTLEKKPNFQDQKILNAYDLMLGKKNINPVDFKKMFQKAEAIREKYDPLHAMRRSEVLARQNEILKDNPNITFDELCLRLYGKNRGVSA